MQHCSLIFQSSHQVDVNPMSALIIRVTGFVHQNETEISTTAPLPATTGTQCGPASDVTDSGNGTTTQPCECLLVFILDDFVFCVFLSFVNITASKSRLYIAGLPVCQLQTLKLLEHRRFQILMTISEIMAVSSKR